MSGPNTSRSDCVIKEPYKTMNKYSCYETDKCLIKIISAIEDNELILEFVS